jgi:hypothetical protein
VGEQKALIMTQNNQFSRVLAFTRGENESYPPYSSPTQDVLTFLESDYEFEGVLTPAKSTSIIGRGDLIKLRDFLNGIYPIGEE